MVKFRITAGAVSLAVVTLAAATSAFADPEQFVLPGAVGMSYSSSTGLLSTPINGDSTTVSFPAGTAAYALFPSGISVDIKIIAAKNGALLYQPEFGQSATNPMVLSYKQFLTDTDLTIIYTGAPVVENGRTILSKGEVITELTDAESELTGSAVRPGKSGTAPIGIEFSFDDTSPPTAGDYTGGGFFDYTPNGEPVVEDSFDFNDSSKGATLAGTTGAYVSMGAYSLQSFSFSPVGNNLSADPIPSLSVPEPVSWSLMVIGVGMAGGFARRRSGASLAA
jgi:hypothetical protein